MTDNNYDSSRPDASSVGWSALAPKPTVGLAVIPIAFLLVTILAIMLLFGTDRVAQASPYVLLAAAVVCVVVSLLSSTFSGRHVWRGMRDSVRQTAPAIPLLVFIATVAATWMFSGIVPTLIHYGIDLLNPTFFLVITCAVCAFISILTGSSWTTIATIGVAFMGIGTVLGYGAGWIAGAIISGAYFGDKMSPLSDTTVISSSSCGVDLFEHIRYMMLTSGPAMLISLIVFMIAGLLSNTGSDIQAARMVEGIERCFNITPWVLVVPVITGVLIICRVPTIITLAASSLMGLGAIFVFQPGIVAELTGGADSVWAHVSAVGHVLFTETTLDTGDSVLDSLITTGGIAGMLPTVLLVVCAMAFGGVMMGTGMLTSVAEAFTRAIRNRCSLVTTTAASGLMLNACTADQYLSIIVGANMYQPVYKKFGLEPRLLSRTVEDSTSVTSVLIPWNSCGITQATVLGVATLAYAPYCVFNYLSPVMSLVMIWTGWRVRSHMPAAAHATA